MSRWYTVHIKNEILFWFFSLALVPLLVLTSVNYIYQKVQYKEMSKEHLSLLLEKKLSSVNEKLYTISKEIEILSETSNIKEALVTYKNEFEKNGKKFNSTIPLHEKFFYKVLSENGFYDIFLISTSGDIVYSVTKESDIGTNLMSGVYSKTNLGKVYKNSMSLLETEFSDFEYYLPSNSDAAFISIPVYGENEILGVLAIQINNQKIIEIFNDKKGLGETGEFFAAKINKYNNIISTTPLKNNKKSVLEEFQFPDNKELPVYKAANGEQGVGILNDYVGDEIVAAWGYIPTLRWGVVVKMDLKEVLKPIDNLRFYSILILFFVSLGIIAAILTAIKHIVEPIEKLTIGVQKFANGKMQTAVDVDVDNEIGELSKNFNEMAVSLKSSQDTIQKYANELEEKVQIRTNELESTKNNLEQSSLNMKKYLSIVDKYVITSSTDKKGVITKVSIAFCNITGYSKEELIGKKHNIIRHPDMSDDFYKDLWKTIAKGETWSGELKNQRKDGSFYWVSATITPVFDENGDIKEYTSIRQDITDKKRVEELSITDQLTKLNNRLKLEEVFNTEIERSKRYNQEFSMILLDIDHFKLVNDNYGHDVGDETLKDVARILSKSVRATDIVGRWGGEEFIVVASQTNLKQTMILAEKIRKNIEDHKFKVIGTKTSSFGVSTFKSNDTQETLVKRADDALYKAKDGGRNCVVTLEEV